MCGIVGIIRKKERVSYQEIENLTGTMMHRGPDEGGIYVKNNYGIGHRRLSIIDIGNGQQPMANNDDSIWIVFNGEIYNYLELKTQLVNKGHKFKTNCDTEVILEAYQEWGIECLQLFRGMFAFALIDEKEKKCYIARDGFGIKPLVYYRDDSMFAFASEIQTLKSLNNFDKSLDLQAMDQYLWLQYIPAPKTIYENAKKLIPGHYLVVDFELNVSRQIHYFKIDCEENRAYTQKEVINQLDKILLDTVSHHMLSDVPCGAFLSGGIDSTLITDYMSRCSNSPVKTFSIGFKESNYSELEYAKYVSDLLGTEHYYKIVESDALKVLPQLVKNYGEPFGDSSAVPTYYVSQLASQYVKLVLSGDGADEMFGGYGWTYSSWIKNNLSIPEAGHFTNILYQVATRTKMYTHSTTLDLDTWLALINYMNRDLRTKLWKEDYRDLVNLPLDIFEEAWKQAQRLSAVKSAQYMDMHTYLPYDIMSKVDIASMMQSLEVRTPFVDKEVLKFAMRVPDKYIYKYDLKGMYQGKLLLKQLMKKKYSKDFLFRTKQGFAIPLCDWFCDKNNYAYEIKNDLLSTSARISHYFKRDVIEDILNGDNTGRIWVMIFLEEWLKQNS